MTTYDENLSTDEVAYTTGNTAKPLSIKATSSDSGTLSYQWYKDDTEIKGATSSSYIPTTDEAGTFNGVDVFSSSPALEHIDTCSMFFLHSLGFKFKIRMNFCKLH